MTKEEIKQKVTDRIRLTADIEPYEEFDCDKNLAEYGFDSLDRVELAMDLEKEFKLADALSDQLDEMANADQMIDYIHKKLNT